MRTSSSLALLLMLVLATSPARADRAEPFDGGTVTLQSMAGVGGGIVGGALLGVVGFAIGEAVAGSRDWTTPLATTMLGASLGGLVGVPVGVKLAGDARDATGSWGATVLGTVTGVVVVGGLALAVEQSGARVPGIAKVAVGAALLVAAPVIGYQLSNDGPADPATMFALPAVRF